MATEHGIVVGPDTPDKLRSFEQTTGAGIVQSEAVALVDPDDISRYNKFVVGEPAAGTVGLVVYEAPAGTFAYRAVRLTSGSFAPVGRFVALRIYATSAADGQYNIGGGDTITVEKGTGVDFLLRTAMIDPIINWISGALDVLLERAA